MKEQKQIIVLGSIGNTARQNRDNMRVLDRGGQMYALKSHIDKDHPLIVRKNETDNNNRSDG